MWLIRRSAVILLCTLFGCAYGGICGGIYGTFFLPIVGTAVGGILGALAGGVTGFLGGVVRGPWGWGLAGALGGAASACASLGMIEPELYGRVLTTSPVLPAVMTYAPPLIGGLVGVGIGAGLRRGSSRLPGVSNLARTIEGLNAPDEVAKRPGVSTEMAPAASPPGSG